MPQAGGSKSAVYRSFITCEDPKGVVDCGLKMRRSKSNGGSYIMDEPKKIEVRRNPKNLSTRASSLELISQEDEHFQSYSSSSSSAFRIMEVSRGAQRLNNMIDSWLNENNRFDKGHSKDIFAKDLLKGALDLQESLVMLGKLQEASQYMNSFNTKKHMEMHERAYSDQYGDQDYIKPRPSSVELKKVIRDSLVRQKLISNAEKGSVYDYSYSESTPSTSSSRSSSLCHNASEYSSISSQKTKGPSLISKLMGIEEYPLKSLQDVEKVPNPQRPSFEIDRPKVMIRKPQTVDPEKRTLKEVLDTMRFKGLLRNNSFEELKFESHHSSSLELAKSSNGVSPPIVLIKPISEKESKGPIVRGEEAFDNRRMLKKLTPMRKTSSQEGGIKHKEEVNKHGEKETKTKDLAAKKAKSSQPLHQKPHEAIDKRVDKYKKVAADNRKPVEKDTLKAKSVSKNKSEDQEKQTLAKKARKPESGSNNTKTHVSRQPSTVTSTSAKCTTSQNAMSNSSERRRNQLRKEQPVKKPREDKSVTKNVVSEEIVKRTSISDESESSLISSNAGPAVQLTKEDENKTYGSHSEGYCNSVLSFLSGATSLSSMQEKNTAEEVSEDISQCVKNEKAVGCGDSLRDFILSSASFLSHVEECYNLGVNTSTIFRRPYISSSAICNTRLVLDCASELVECKSFRQKTVGPVSPTSQGKPRVTISLHKLVENVCNGIETLLLYSKLASENTIADSLFLMLERDIMCKGVGKATWDLSWRIGFSDNEVEQVVCDIEKLVFNGLIEEVFA